ncbi:hypothetical protein AMELA_G00178400 [Ameiurus melas]|uniref:Uncharacterized protein n=1 Tax=Ameiurus melas TaxID=219545 RepID=A0A7J6ABR7_AMEME|nr:hypothetical protein AMELA_G00178400 [Ameiurus melas]
MAALLPLVCEWVKETLCKELYKWRRSLEGLSYTSSPARSARLKRRRLDAGQRSTAHQSASAQRGETGFPLQSGDTDCPKACTESPPTCTTFWQVMDAIPQAQKPSAKYTSIQQVKPGPSTQVEQIVALLSARVRSWSERVFTSTQEQE